MIRLALPSAFVALMTFTVASTPLLIATPAMAQSTYCPTVTSTPCLQAKQNVNSRTFQIGFENPVTCDDEIITAAAVWTSGGSKFSTTKDSAYWSGKRVAGTPKYQITFQPGADFYNTTALAETPYGNSVAGFAIDGKTIPVVDDADILVNSDKWAAGTIECASSAPTASQYDLAALLAHEFGHLTGQNHVTVTTCATYTYGQPGKAYYGVCAAEKSALVRLYGAL